MKKGDLVRRIALMGSPLSMSVGIPVGPYLIVSGPKEGAVKVSDHYIQLSQVVSVYYDGKVLENQPLYDFEKV